MNACIEVGTSGLCDWRAGIPVCTAAGDGGRSQPGGARITKGAHMRTREAANDVSDDVSDDVYGWKAVT